MLEYTKHQIYAILCDLLDRKDFDIIPVGNHELKRHLVFRVDFNSGDRRIFKLYYKDRRRSREIASYKLLANSTVKCPRVIQFGNLEDGTQWLMISFIEGELLDTVMHKLSDHSRHAVFEQMGIELGKIHSYQVFDFVGEWDETGKSINNRSDYYSYYVEYLETCIKDIEQNMLPDKEVLIEAIKKVRNLLPSLDVKVIPRLIHNDFDGRNILVDKKAADYELKGIIDFEGCFPGNPEENFINLYYRYFLEHRDLEEAFFKGYNRYLQTDAGFYDRLPFYLLCFAISNCSWAFYQARDYYFENIKFLKEQLSGQSLR